jgi:hypothetical protein
MRDPEVDKDIVPFLQVEFEKAHKYPVPYQVSTFRATDRDPAFSKYLKLNFYMKNIHKVGTKVQKPFLKAENHAPGSGSAFPIRIRIQRQPN